MYDLGINVILCVPNAEQQRQQQHLVWQPSALLHAAAQLTQA